MQSLKLLLSATALLAGLGPNAVAEGWYAELTTGSFETDAASDWNPEPSLDYDTLGLRAGYALNAYFAIESDLMLGLDDVTLVGGPSYSDYIVDLRSSAAIFARMSAPVSERLSVHARLGYASNELHNSSVGDATDGYIETFEGAAYGIGTQYDLTDLVYLRADYTAYDSKLRESQAVNFGGGVDLFQVAKVLNDLRD